MNKHVKQLFAAVLDNEIVCAGTNLKQFRDDFLEIEPDFWDYYKLYPKIKKYQKAEFISGDKKYLIQVYKP